MASSDAQTARLACESCGEFIYYGRGGHFMHYTQPADHPAEPPMRDIIAAALADGREEQAVELAALRGDIERVIQRFVPNATCLNCGNFCRGDGDAHEAMCWVADLERATFHAIPALTETTTTDGGSQREGERMTEPLFDIPEGMAIVVSNVILERRRQHDELGYDPEHDDAHLSGEWIELLQTYIEQMTRATHPEFIDDPDEYRRRVIQVAAIAVAQAESYDRAIEGRIVK